MLLYPKFRREFDKAVDEERWDRIVHRRFQTAKERLITVDIYLERQKNIDARDREALVKMILQRGPASVPVKGSTKKWFLSIPYFKSKSSVEEDLLEQACAICSSVTDAQFLSQIQKISSRDPLLGSEVTAALDLSHRHFQDLIRKKLNVLFAKFQQIQEQTCRMQIRHLADSEKEGRQRLSRRMFLQEMQESIVDNSWATNSSFHVAKYSKLCEDKLSN